MLAALTERLRNILKGQSHRKIDYLLLGDPYLRKHLHLFCQGPDIFEALAFLFFLCALQLMLCLENGK